MHVWLYHWFYHWRDLANHAGSRLVQVTGKRAATYWIGLALDANSNRWVWADGDSAGNGAVSNSNPYAHW
jgi:hypothetical protein